MTLTDLNGPMSLQPRRPGLGRISHSNRFAVLGILFFSCATFGATISRGQDQQNQSVAEAARQERARKQESQQRAKHVYTEEDLKHPNILTPEDRAQVEAKRNECARKNNCLPAPSQNSPASLDANSQSPLIPLGDVARQLRKQKELQALKPKQPEAFHLPYSVPALASPIFVERAAIHPPARPVLRPRSSLPKMPSNVFRRDPFSAATIRPEIRRTEIRRTETRSSVHENISSAVHANVHASVPEKIRPTVRPKVSSDFLPKVRENALPAVHTMVHPGFGKLDFSKDVRPTLRAHRRLTAPVLPKFSPRPAPPGIFVLPMHTAAFAKSAQPVSPVASVNSTQPRPVLGSRAILNRTIVRVQPGDSLWKLAQQNLGRGNRWRELLAANPAIVDPNQIRIGARLRLPVSAATSVAATRNTANSASIGRASTIKVRRGDTLWGLAESTLGRSSFWPCLAAANPSLSDPNRIYENQDLFVPAGCRP